MKHNLRAGLVAGALSAALVTTLPAAPAAASSMGMFRESGTTASSDWIEFGKLGPTVEGNVHVGSLEVFASSKNNTYVFGSVADWTCPDGERPPDSGHGHFSEVELLPPVFETNCQLESIRGIFADPSMVSFTVNKKLTSARLTGTLSVSDHGSGAGANPPVDMTWTGTGDLYSSKNSGTFRDGDSTYRYSYSFSGRDAEVDGRIGAMGFADDLDDESSGQLGSYRNAERFRSR